MNKNNKWKLTMEIDGIERTAFCEFCKEYEENFITGDSGIIALLKKPNVLMIDLVNSGIMKMELVET